MVALASVASGAVAVNVIGMRRSSTGTCAFRRSADPEAVVRSSDDATPTRNNKRAEHPETP
jgi:hypothetical protein